MKRPSFHNSLAVFSVFIGLAGLPSARAQNFNGKTVVAIQYEPASQPLHQHDLADMQLVQIGQPLKPEQVATTIDRLFASGMFDDIQVHAEPSGNGVSLRFVTRPRRFIGHVGAQGRISDPPSRSVIISDAQLNLGQPFDPQTLEVARKNIEQEMRDNGLFEATVGVATVEDSDTHQVTVRFIVDAGRRARYEMPAISGETKLSDETIVRATGWRIPLIHWWRKVTDAQTDRGLEGIRNKYAKIGRLTASVDLSSLDYDADRKRVKPNLDIDAGPKIQIKAVEAKVSKAKLRKYVPVFEEGAVDNDLLAEGARNLRDYFQSKGYPDVDVTFKSEPVQNDLQTINFYIATGPRRRLVNVAIAGNTYFATDSLRERMFLRPSSFMLRYGRYSETFRKNDEQAIENLYRANGFRDVKVTSAVETNYRNRPNDIAVTFHIDPGKQWRVGQLSIRGANLLDLTPIRSRFTSAEGQPFSEINIATDRNLILDYYYSHGFPSASFTYSVVDGAAPQTVDLSYQITEGPREFVRGVIVSGLYRTRPSLVERRINIQEGEPISMVKVNDTARRLTNLGIFANVDAALQNPDGSTRYKYVLFDVDEAARYTFNVGFGLELGQFGHTTNSLANSGGAKAFSPIVSFNVNRLNFLGRAQTISLQTRYSSIEQRESLNYVIPQFMGSAGRTLTFSALYNTTQDVQTFSSRRLEASAQISQRLNRASTLLLRFAYRRVSTGNLFIPSLLVPQLSQPVRVGILSASYIQDHRDNPGDAHRGFLNTIDTGLAGNFFGSQRNFYRVLARNATYTSIGRNLVFARQTQIGAIVPFNVPAGTNTFEAIPLPERFFGGGGASMRGFGYNQAGPRDIGTTTELPLGPSSCPPNPPTFCSTGFPIGGNGIFFNTFELRFPLLWPNISGVAFHDMGNIYTSFSDISLRYNQINIQNFNYAAQAAGFGIRYKTPLGPVRVDLAYALNPPRYIGFSTSETIQQIINNNRCTNQTVGTPTCPVGPQRLRSFQFFFSIGQAF